MHKLLEKLIEGYEFTGDLSSDSYRLFCRYGKESVAEHTQKVAAEAVKLAERFEIDVNAAATAGYLHDVGRVYSDDLQLEAAEELGIAILDEERVNTSLLHQKLSRVIAAEVFGINDDFILDAISCHSTLRANASRLDLILLTADKLSWDSKDNKPFLQGILNGLEKSLEHGAFSYLSYSWDKRKSMKVIHPRMIEAYEDLKKKCI